MFDTLPQPSKPVWLPFQVSALGMPGYLRLSFATYKETPVEGCRRLVNSL